LVVTVHHDGVGLCLDAGYTGAKALVEKTGYTAHIRPRGGGETGERTESRVQNAAVGGGGLHSRLNRFRKLLIRYEKKNR
jgi:hypothetical protein